MINPRQRGVGADIYNRAQPLSITANANLLTNLKANPTDIKADSTQIKADVEAATLTP